jgi:hypothetical protein
MGIRRLLEPIRPFVEEMGARVIDKDDPASSWWYCEGGRRTAA